MTVRLHLVDGTYELFRAHFSQRPDHTAPGGIPVKATVGVAASLLYLLDEEAEGVTHIAVAFDNPIRSFRNELFEGYKTEEGMPSELIDQMGPVEEAVRALGIVVWSMSEYEADDALATAAARFRTEVDQVRILTPDKDLGQCIRGKSVVQVDRRKKEEVDEAGLVARRGILPASIPDWLALTGDTADGIPGLRGFGEKTASALLGHYRHIEDIPDNPTRWAVKVRGAERLAAELAGNRERAIFYRRLATLVETVPLRESLDELRFRGVPRDAFAAWCASLGVDTLSTRPTRWAD